MWPRERRQFRLGGAKHLDCVVREARCKADPSTFRETLELTLQQEIARMRDLGASRDAIAAFQAAADVHFALCGTGEPPKDADDAEPSSGDANGKSS
ncbi:MAG TPA: hypothetical protein VHZ01_04415 [Casimicrobiaceae bacterium]|jgi:hypothetical protein|nr:hypothetical protein [Casimicrobiaceae bacterium]